MLKDRTHSQVHLRPPAAPPVRVSHQQATPGHERGNERGGRERESVLQINRHEESIWEKQREEERSKRKSPEEESQAEDSPEEEPRGRVSMHQVAKSSEEGAPRACPSFMEQGSALRSAPFRAPPPFWKLPKKGSSPLPTASPRASTNRGRAAPPCFCHTRRKQAGKIRAPLGTPVVSFRAGDCGGGRTVDLKWLVVCVEDGCVLDVAVWMAWLLRFGCGDVGCGDVGCSKITTGKEKRLSQRVAVR